MYLIDTDIISQLAKRNPNSGVTQFFADVKQTETAIFLSAITIGEIRKGIAKLHGYGDEPQATQLDYWFQNIKTQYSDFILPFDAQAAEIWGEILAATDETNPLDKQIAATALLYDLCVVTRNTGHMMPTGVKCMNPFLT